jgi:hypothetical protein
MRTRSRVRRNALAVAAAFIAAAAAGCTTPPGGGGPGGPSSGIIQTPYAVACDGPMDHSGDGMDHGGGGGGGMPGMPGMHGPARLQHEPCDAQKAAARKLVADTRAAVARMRQNTLAGLMSQGFFSIGDGITGTTHYTKNSVRNDSYNLDPDHVEEYAVRNGRVVAAMYVLGVGMTMDNVPDIAGNWTMWHDHVLTWQSNNPNSPAYYKLGGMFSRREPPMLHVWLEKNACGPFAGTDSGAMSGSCVKGIE